MNNKANKVDAFARLLDVLDMLRTHCPWDKKQTNASLRTNTIEEVHELSEALLSDNTAEEKKELGDVLLHIVFYAKIAEEQGKFDIADVCNTLCNKLIFRHPHIYGNAQADSAEAVVNQWERVKQVEKGGNKTLLSGVPSSLPSLVKAYRISEKAAAVGFDWKERTEVWQKVAEERTELDQAIAQNDPDAMEAEMGDLLFAIVNAARLYGINPDTALERTNRKFTYRIGFAEEKARQKGLNLSDLTLDEMETLCQEAKKSEKNRN